MVVKIPLEGVRVKTGSCTDTEGEESLPRMTMVAEISMGAQTTQEYGVYPKRTIYR
jgi:hypothetical protein